METLRLILVPMDGSPPSIAALDHALAFALDYDANVEILHVVKPVDSLSSSALAAQEEVLDAAVDRARAQLPDRITLHRVVGDPVREILEVAAADACDLIVMGTHGHGGRIHTLLGSVAGEVVRNASCPVLTVRDATSDYQSFAERRHHRPTLAEQMQHR